MFLLRHFIRIVSSPSVIERINQMVYNRTNKNSAPTHLKDTEDEAMNDIIPRAVNRDAQKIDNVKQARRVGVMNKGAYANFDSLLPN
ncbi:hypothetical protein H2248_002239 [Termitomyces sp. 'cryptogamus']|nr:hypothetical protein H2248_002239 [Termitomyces sp. 'cryptogamus']